METSVLEKHSILRPMFKSYYVVWKHKSISNFFGLELRFKSYYVVWKLPYCFIFFVFFFVFKSYYVVWKLLLYSSLCSSVSLFKSYYVVWKPSATCFFSCVGTGLNRTMQYGNIRVSPTFFVLSSSLNRTMQYGNASILIMNDSIVPV